MGKRSNFERVERDAYFTPRAPVEPLIDHLPYSFNYIEPCAGDGRLVRHITDLTDGNGVCELAFDIEPMDPFVAAGDALEAPFTIYGSVDYIITNPPWDRSFLHSFIEKYTYVAPTWLLFDADWMHTKQSSVYMTYCSKVVSVGRVKWIEDSNSTGKDNVCWYLFDINKSKPTEFYGRLV